MTVELETLVEQDFDLVFGRVAVKRGLLTQAQVEMCVREQDRAAANGAPPPIGQVAVRLGLLDAAQAASVRGAQRYGALRIEDRLFGNLACRNAFVTREQVEDALLEQARCYRRGAARVPRVAELMIAGGLLTTQEAEAVLRAQARLFEETVCATRPSAARRSDGSPMVVRNYERFAVRDAEALCRWGWRVLLVGREGVACRVVDLSEGGAQLEAATAGRRGQWVRLQLWVPAYDRTLPLWGRIRWARPVDGRRRMGIRFVAVRGAARRVLASLAGSPELRAAGSSPFRGLEPSRA